MILVDTSVWIDHLHHEDVLLRTLLNRAQVFLHPFVLGELAMGTLKQREMGLSVLSDLPRAVMAEDAEVLQFVQREALFGLSVGYIDGHLLASSRLTPDALLWTRDKRLRTAAAKLSLAFQPPLLR